MVRHNRSVRAHFLDPLRGDALKMPAGSRAIVFPLPFRTHTPAEVVKRLSIIRFEFERVVPIDVKAKFLVQCTSAAAEYENSVEEFDCLSLTFPSRFSRPRAAQVSEHTAHLIDQRQPIKPSSVHRKRRSRDRCAIRTLRRDMHNPRNILAINKALNSDGNDSRHISVQT